MYASSSKAEKRPDLIKSNRIDKSVAAFFPYDVYIYGPMPVFDKEIADTEASLSEDQIQT